MRNILSALLLLVSSSLLADPPECTQIPGSCRDWNPSYTKGQTAAKKGITATVSEPATTALMGLGLVGIAVARKRKR